MITFLSSHWMIASISGKRASPASTAENEKIP